MHPNKERLLRLRRVGFIPAVILTNFLSPFQGSEACCARSRGRALRFAPRLPLATFCRASGVERDVEQIDQFRTPPSRAVGGAVRAVRVSCGIQSCLIPKGLNLVSV